MEFWAKTDKHGKPGISVRDHCINVGCVAEAIFNAANIGFFEARLVIWLAATHDIGKISPGFLQKCAAWIQANGLEQAVRRREWTTAVSDHSKVSQFTLQHVLKEQRELPKETAALWAAISAMHHGSPHWGGQWGQALKHGIPLHDHWEKDRRLLAQELGTIFGMPQTVPVVENPHHSTLWWTAGLITVADWIGSDEHYFSPDAIDCVADVTERRAAAAAAIQEIGFSRCDVRQGLTFHQLFNFDPNPLQIAAVKAINVPGVYVIEAPMGMGKTEAALAAAYSLISKGHAKGLYFALPTQATSNRIHERVGSFLERIEGGTVRLIHSGSWLLDDKLRFPSLTASQPEDQQRSVRDWFASAKRALLAPYGVGTVDQALMGVIAVRHFFVRHFALAKKVVILDEVHSYDMYTGTLLDALVEALNLLGCTVIILSATLTRERREKLLQRSGGTSILEAVSDSLRETEPFPMITGSSEAGRMTPIPITVARDKPPISVQIRKKTDALSEAVEAARGGACVLWICNTVDEAQSTYGSVCTERCEGDPPVGLLHSRFPFFRRAQLEEEWTQALGKQREFRPLGCILIGSQILEQSLDIDADLLVTELAPTDMLLQRIGRLWRHPRETDEPRARTRPEIWILEEEMPLEKFTEEADERAIRRALGKKAKIYAPYVLLRSMEIWSGKAEIETPSDIRKLLEATYVERSEDARPGWKLLYEQMIKKKNAHCDRAEQAQNVWQSGSLPDEEGIGTRLNDSPTVPLVLAVESVGDSLTLLNGERRTVQADWFDYELARTMHRNVVKVPRWCVKRPNNAGDASRMERSVAKHVSRDGCVGILAEGKVLIDGNSDDVELGYSAALGITIARPASSAAPFRNWEDDDDLGCDW